MVFTISVLWLSEHFGGDDPETDGKFVVGVMGLLQNNSIDAAIGKAPVLFVANLSFSGDYNLQKGRMGNFQYTPPYDYQPVNIICIPTITDDFRWISFEKSEWSCQISLVELSSS